MSLVRRFIAGLIFAGLLPLCVAADVLPPTAETRKIREVRIFVNDVFVGSDLWSGYTAVNSIKINTRDEVVRRELLFKPGDALSQFVIDESMRNLRQLPYFRSVESRVIPAGDEVDIEVHVRDTWTLIPQFSYSSGEGNSDFSLGVAESNLAGMGKRLEALYNESDSRRGIETVYDDPRVWGTQVRSLLGYFHRNDGDRYLALVGQPFRTLVDRKAWRFNLDSGHSIGRLFENGDERFIYRQNNEAYGARYGFARGPAESHVRRYIAGYDYIDDRFDEAREEDFEDLEIDPDSVSRDPALVPDNRRWSGPVLGYESIEPDYIAMSDVDRFERVQDFNLGEVYSATTTIAPEVFGSSEDALLLSGNYSEGTRYDCSGFLRGEFGVASRATPEDFDNTLFRLQLRAYDVLGSVFAGGTSLGRHTLAASFDLEYGIDLDGDRELLLGAENGLRGYESKTFTGDKRFILNLEDRMHFVDNVFRVMSVGAAVFADVGAATTEPFGDLFTDELYADVGVGLRLAFPTSSGGRVVRIDLAFPLREGPDGSDFLEPRLLLTGGQVFSSRLRSETSGPERANVEVGLDR